LILFICCLSTREASESDDDLGDRKQLDLGDDGGDESFFFCRIAVTLAKALWWWCSFLPFPSIWSSDELLGVESS
jgi:hypothetical protein